MRDDVCCCGGAEDQKIKEIRKGGFMKGRMARRSIPEGQTELRVWSEHHTGSMWARAYGAHFSGVAGGLL
jgi:hypothetical protein